MHAYSTDTLNNQEATYYLKLKHCLFLFSLFVFFAGFFLFPNSKLLNTWYYATVIPLTLLNLDSIHWKNNLKDLGIYIVGLYFIYCLLSGLWSQSFSLDKLFDLFKHILYLINFFLAAVILQKMPKKIIEQAITLLIIAAVISSIISIVMWYSYNPTHTRLVGFFRSQHSIASSWLMGFPLFICLHYYLSLTSTKKAIYYLVLALPMLAYVLLTQSRGPLVAFVLTAILFLLYHRNRRSLYLIAIVIFLIGVNKPLFLRSMITFTFRQHIWETVWQQAWQQPWFGYGYLTSVKVNTLNTVFAHAHNVYLQIFFLGGLVGLFIQSLFMGRALWIGWQNRSNQFIATTSLILIFALLCMLSDGGRLITNPKEIWMSFWLPLFVLLTYPPIFLNKKVTTQPLRKLE